MHNSTTLAPLVKEAVSRYIAEPRTRHKQAGLRDAVTLALTGRVPLYHGTSAARAKLIRAGKGVMPDVGVGFLVSYQI